MGTLIHTFKGTNRFLVGISGVVIGVFLLLIFFYVPLGSSKYKLAALCGGQFIIVGSIIVFFGAFFQKSYRVNMYTDGLEEVHGDTITHTHWHEIAEVFQIFDEEQGKLKSLRLKLVDGTEKQFEESNMRKMDRFTDLIVDHTTEHLLPKATQQFEQDETLTFGPLQLSRSTGLLHEDQMITWDSISKLRRDNMRLTIHAQGQPARFIDTHDLPNQRILMTLLYRQMPLKVVKDDIP